MKNIKNKLSSKSGASMLLALVFLLFCMLVGGSVLSAASANGSRAARQKEDQQAYLSQRSASMLLADMLKSTDDAAMQLTIKDVTSSSGRTITFMAHGEGDKSQMQMLLYDLAMAKHIASLGTAEYATKFVNFPDGYYVSTNPLYKGKISITLKIGELEYPLNAQYDASDDEKFVIDYAVAPPPVGEETQPPQHSYVTLSMKCYTAKGQPVTVNGTTTTTTIIRWDDPVIEKGGA